MQKRHILLLLTVVPLVTVVAQQTQPGNNTIIDRSREKVVGSYNPDNPGPSEDNPEPEVKVPTSLLPGAGRSPLAGKSGQSDTQKGFRTRPTAPLLPNQTNQLNAERINTEIANRQKADAEAEKYKAEARKDNEEAEKDKAEAEKDRAEAEKDKAEKDRLSHEDKGFWGRGLSFWTVVIPVVIAAGSFLAQVVLRLRSDHHESEMEEKRSRYKLDADREQSRRDYQLKMVELISGAPGRSAEIFTYWKLLFPEDDWIEAAYRYAKGNRTEPPDKSSGRT